MVILPPSEEARPAFLPLLSVEKGNEINLRSVDGDDDDDDEAAAAAAPPPHRPTWRVSKTRLLAHPARFMAQKLA